MTAANVGSRGAAATKCSLPFLQRQLLKGIGLLHNIAFPRVEFATVRNHQAKILFDLRYTLVLIRLEFLEDRPKVHRMCDDLKVQRDPLTDRIHRLRELVCTGVGKQLFDNLFALGHIRGPVG